MCSSSVCAVVQVGIHGTFVSHSSAVVSFILRSFDRDTNTLARHIRIHSIVDNTSQQSMFPPCVVQYLLITVHYFEIRYILAFFT